MNCWWCHNPEGQSTSCELILRPDRCIRCGQCLAMCEQEAIEWVDGRLTTTTKCQSCFRCVKVCPSEARLIVGRKLNVDQVMAEIEKDRVFYDLSGGGVTFSGGEPLKQPDFLQAVLKECRAKDIHTAVETAGLSNLDHLLKIADQTDLFLYDLKVMDEKQHIKYTGVSNKIILANLTTLAGLHDNIIIRIPIIPGINDSESDLNEFIDFISGLRIREVHLLPYHKTGEGKYGSLGKPYRMSFTGTPDTQAMESIADKFETCGRKVKIGG